MESPAVTPERVRVTSVEPTPSEAVKRVQDTASRGLEILSVRSKDPSNPNYVKVREDGAIQVGDDRIGRWINTKDSNLAKKEGLGYEICKDPKVATMSKAVGQHKINELVFMTCRRDDYEARKKEDRRIADARRKGTKIKEEFKEEAARLGLKTFDDSERR